MNLNNKLKGVSDEFDLSHREMLRIVYSDIENDLTSFRMEIKDAANVETLEFLRRHFWDRLFSENGGVYYELCMRSPMLKILRLNADIRYCQLLKQKQRKESQQVNLSFEQELKQFGRNNNNNNNSNHVKNKRSH